MERSLALIESGAINPDRMTTHRFPYTRVPEVLDLLHDHPNHTPGVALHWKIDES